MAQPGAEGKIVVTEGMVGQAEVGSPGRGLENEVGLLAVPVQSVGKRGEGGLVGGEMDLARVIGLVVFLAGDPAPPFVGKGVFGRGPPQAREERFPLRPATPPRFGPW